MTDLLDRVAAQIDFREDGCWTGTPLRHLKGYARVFVDGKQPLLHRLVWEMTVGPIPEGIVLDHLCGVRNCCNPDHLEPVTQTENNRRSNQTNKVTCRKGLHSWDETSIYVSPKGKVYCRPCNHATGRRNYAARRAARQQHNT